MDRRGFIRSCTESRIALRVNATILTLPLRRRYMVWNSGRKMVVSRSAFKAEQKRSWANFSKVHPVRDIHELLLSRFSSDLIGRELCRLYLNNYASCEVLLKEKFTRFSTPSEVPWFFGEHFDTTY